jgi:hypothetical protein
MDDPAFSGFGPPYPIRVLRLTQADVPKGSGVYLVRLPAIVETPSFRTVSVGGHFKGNDPTVAVSRLKAKWVQCTQVLYVGKSTNLLRRLRQLLRFGAGEPVGKWGGLFVWQLAHPEGLEIAWKELEGDPTREEARLLEAFERAHGKLPFANLKRVSL